MHASIDSVNAIGKRVFGTGPAIVILQGQFDFYAIDFTHDTDWSRLQYVSILVQVTHKRNDATFKIEGCFTIATLVDQHNGHATVEISHLTETLRKDFKTVVARL